MGLTNSKGIQTYSDGSVYNGDIAYGRKHGQGTMNDINGDIYLGGWSDNNKHGHGEMKYANGDIYLGGWRDNRKHGQGEMKYANGDIYIGGWCYNEKHGHGEMKYKDGSSYLGDWNQDNKAGLGKLIDADGSIYIGKWDRNRKYGQGKITYRDGSCYEGDWVYDLKHGRGKITYPDGSSYDGTWHMDKMTNIGTCLMKIKQEDFKLDLQYLTNIILDFDKQRAKFIIDQHDRHASNNVQHDRRDTKDNAFPTYDLIFEGDITGKTNTSNSKLYIEGLFEFQGHWLNGKANGKGLLYNIQEKTYEEVHHCYGVRLEPKNKIPIETAVVPQLMGDQVEVEGAV